MDALIAKLGGGDAEAGTTALAGILQAHVVPQKLLAADLQAQDYATLTDGETITITTDGNGNVFADGAQVITPNIEADNGVVHIINAVINLETPPAETPATVVDVVVAQESLSTLETALTETSLVQPLQGDGPFTLFAPDNAAFTALLEAQQVTDLAGLIEKLGLPAVTGILQAHVVSGNLLAADLQVQDYPTLNGDESITITKDENGNVFADGAQVTTPDLASGNGVVHIINAVINLPAPPAEGATVVETIADNDDLNSLEEAINGVGPELTATLQGTGPFTVFAPDNAAFQALLTAQEVNTVDELITKLGATVVADILQAHVIPNQQLAAADLMDQQVYESLDGATPNDHGAGRSD